MDKIVIVGLGTIGKSISLALAQNNCDIIVITRRGEEGFRDLCRFVEKETVHARTQKNTKQIMSRITRVDHFREIPCNIQLVIEAIKENLAEKQKIFQEMDCVFSPAVILSSTTSSLSITEISKLMTNPQRMIGLHFFNPAHMMTLTEIIPGEKTSDETLKKTQEFAKQIGMFPLVVPDQPGFVVNRLLFAMMNEAFSLVGSGKISAEDIDTAAKLGVHHPMGPLHLADFIGLDVCLTILENLYSTTKSDKYKPNRALIEKVENKNLGRKTGRGFFTYDNKASKN